MRLIDGLRYYDEGCEKAGDEYKEYLKSLQHEAITPMDWREKRNEPPVPDKK